MSSIFISSTFRDMQEERDLIYRQVSPIITKEAQSFGENISFCDLRWGVNTLELDPLESSKKVLQVCFDEIDRARPYLVVLLGDRYGWVPDEETLREMGIVERLPGISVAGKSVTELEIRYGAFHDKETLAHTLFYFREFSGPLPEGFDCENDDERKKLAELKAEIRKKCGKNVKTYTWDPTDLSGSRAAFSALLEQDLKALLQTEQKHAKDPHAREMQMYYTIMEGLKKQKTARPKVISDILSKASDVESTILVLRGEEGDGLEYLLAGVAAVREAEGDIVIPVFAGRSTECGNCLDLLKLLTTEIETRAKLPKYKDQLVRDRNAQILQAKRRKKRLHLAQLDANDEKDRWLSRLSQDLKALSSQKKHLTLIIDGLSRLTNSLDAQRLIFLPDEIPYETHIYLSAAKGLSIDHAKVSEYVVPKIGKEEAGLLLDELLQDHGKELDAAVRKQIMKKKSTSSALYLRLIMMRLQMMGRKDFESIRKMGDSMEDISAYQRSVITACPDALAPMAKSLLKTMCQELEGDSNGTLPRCLAYLAQSSLGLRISDLTALLAREGKGFNQIAFSQMVNCYDIFFHYDRKGYYRIAYEFLKDICREERGYRLLADYEETLPDDDLLHCRDLPYQLLCFGSPEEIWDTLRRIQEKHEWPLRRVLDNLMDQQLLQTTARIRAAYRQFRGDDNWKTELEDRLRALQNQGRSFLYPNPDYPQLNSTLDTLEDLAREYRLMDEQSSLDFITVYQAIVNLAEEIYRHDPAFYNEEALVSMYNTLLTTVSQNVNDVKDILYSGSKLRILKYCLFPERLTPLQNAKKKLADWNERLLGLHLDLLAQAEKQQQKDLLWTRRRKAHLAFENYFLAMASANRKKEIPAAYHEKYLELKKLLG